MVTFRNIMKKRNTEFRKEMEETSARVMEMVELVPVTRAHALEDEEVSKMSGQLFAVAEKGYKLDLIQALFGSVGWAVFQIFQVICLAFTGYLAIGGKIQAGDITLYQSYFATVVNQVSSIVTLLPTIAKGIESVNSIGEVLLSEDIENNEGKEKLEQVTGTFDFEDVCFHYKNNEHNVLNHLNLHVKAGETIALVGESGAGKSTILKSIARQLSLIAGTVRLDGEDMKSLTGAELSKKMAVVMTKRLRGELMTCEDVVATGRYPYTGRFGVLRAEDHAAVQNAMELVQVAEIGDSLFDRISDGQRQRVMLARAICQEPEILILDEPTSYLDVRHKLEFLSILQKLCRERELTVILSLHELELAEKISDRILCVNGRAVDRIGTPEEVMTAGYITELYGIRMGSYDEGSSDMELAAPEGTPQVFVIAGAGSGRKIYRRLQRAGIPFVTGILYENDLDYPVAKALAAEVIAEHPFEPVAQEKIQAAKKQLEKCNRVICCRENFGSLETYQRELLEYAEQLGKRIEKSESPEQQRGC